MSIRVKLITILSLFSILPCIITGFLALTATRDAILEKTAAHAEEYIHIVGERINAELLHKYEMVLEWSEDHTFSEALQKRTDMEKTFKALEQIEGRHESLAYLALLESDGGVLAGSNRALLKHGKNFLAHKGFQKALSGNPFMEDVKFDELSKESTLLFFTPVRDRSDFKKVRGVLLASFRWEYFSRIVQSSYTRSKKQETGHIMLTTKNGILISGNDYYSEYGTDLVALGLKSAQLALSGKEGFVVEKSEHKDLTLASYTPLQSYPKMPDPGWLIILHQDYNELFSTADKIEKIIVAVTLLLVLLLLYVSFKAGKIITQPILQIASAATKVGRGDLTGNIEVPPHGEINTLAVSFNSMIEELRRSREQIIQSHEYLSGILSSMSDSLIVVCGGKIKEVNWAASTSLGYASEELIGRDMEILFVEPENPLSTGDVNAGDILFVDRETSLKTRSGETFQVLLSCSKLYLPEADLFSELEEGRNNDVGSAADLILIAKDITERKKMEEELRSSRKSAIEANRAKGVFLSNMSHEIRTPMNAIIGMTTLVLDIEKDYEKIECLNIVKTSAEALLALLNDLLDISKIEAGKLQLQKVDFDLSQVVHDSIKSIAFNAHSKKVEIILSISPAIRMVVNGDPLRLRQVIINLVGNAIKFTDTGEVELKVEPVPASENREMEKEGAAGYLFSVRDTGKGIPGKKLEKIFDSFYQVDDSDSRRHDGTGLGLSISREIVELMDGKIWAESEPGKGTIFFFNVTLLNRPHTVDQLQGRVREILRGKKILIVDDNKTNRLLLKHTVESSGCEALEAVDGSDAMNKFVETGAARKPIDLVLMDYYMPGVNGVEAVRMIRDRFNVKNTRFLILSSAARPIDSLRGERDGWLETLLKPVNQTELLYKMSSTIEDVSRPEKVLTEKAGLPPKVPSKNRTILLAEDKKVNQILAVKLLEKQGYSVQVAGNGREAIGALKEGHFDLVLMDVRMPEMDGLEATREIRASDPKAFPADIPIVAMSAFAMEEDRQTCFDAGMNDHVSKPVDRDKLFAVLDKWLPDKL